MLIKSRKGQVLKKINLDNSFAVSGDDKFYIPIELSTPSASFFNVEKILVTFIPVKFTDEIKKPYHIKNNVDNKKSYRSNEVVDEKNSDIFKSIYAKNIVNSKDQNRFINNTFNVNIPISEGDTFEVVTDSLISTIREVTKATTRVISPNTGQIIDQQVDFDDFFIKVYALNNKSEVIDNIEIRSQNINSYIEREASLTQRRKLRILSNRLNEVLDTFNVNFRKFTFTNQTSSDAITIIENTGTEIEVSEEAIQSIIGEEVSEGLLIDLSFYLVDGLNSDNIIELDLITVGSLSLSPSNEDGSLVDVLKNNFNLNCLTNQKYIDIVTSLYSKLVSRNIESITAHYKVIFSASSVESNSLNIDDITYTKEVSFNIEPITQAFNDIKRLNFSSDVKNGRVISADVESNINGTDKNKISLSFDTSIHSKEKVFKNSIEFNFIAEDSSGEKRGVRVEEFYFDANLTTGNSVIVNSNNKIENYVDSDGVVDLYFRLTDAEGLEIDEVSINFYNSFSLSSEVETIIVGPLSLNKNNSSNVSFLEIDQRLLSDFTEISKKIKENTVFSFSSSINLFLLNLLKGNTQQGLNQAINFDFNEFITNTPQIQNLDFFQTTTESTLDQPLDQESSRNEVLGSVLIKIEKVMSINGTNIFSSVFYGFLSDILFLEEVNGVRSYDIFSYNDVTALINEDLFDENSTARSDLSKIRNPENTEYSEISNDFECTFRTSIEPLLLSQKVISCLGSPPNKDINDINNSKSKLVDMIFDLNPSYNVFNLSQLLNLAYTNAFNANREEFVRKLYEITNVSNRLGKVIEASIDKETLIRLDPWFIVVLKTKSRFVDPTCIQV